MRQLVFPLVLLGALAGPARAELSITSAVDSSKIGVEDQVHLTITVSGNQIPQVPMPALTNLERVSAPMTSSRVSFANGTVTRTESYTFVLRAHAVGKAEVGAIRVVFGGSEYVAPAITLDVVAGSVKPKTAAPPPDPMDPFGGEDPLDAMRGRGRARGAEPKVFVEATVNRSRLFVGEPLLLTYWLYTQVSVQDLAFGDPPKYVGFWTEDLPQPVQAPGGEPVTLNGESFRRAPLVQKLLFPTKAGKLPIPPTTLRIGISHGGGFFGMPTNEVVERATKPLEVFADPVPDHPGFSGAVGRFTAAARIDRPVATLGEALTLRFEVQGNGNLKWIDRGPDVALAGAKVYPPQVKSDLKATPAGLTGTKTWEIVVVPETGGTLAIPALTFAYFDPEKRQIVDATTLPLTVEVHGAGTASRAPAPAAARGGGPLPLRSDLDLPVTGGPRLSPAALGLTVGVVLLAHGALWAAPWMLERRRESRGGRPGRGRDLRRAIADLERVGGNGLSKEAAVALIERTLHEVFGPLEESGGAESDRERAAREVLQEVYFIRYAPQLGDYSEQIRDVARRAAEVVRRWA